MKPKALIAANWKMNKLPSEVSAWVRDLKDALTGTVLNADLAICAPYPHLPALVEAVQGTAVLPGAQDVSAHKAGAYTGEVSAAMLRDVGVKTVIIGHSERRQYHQESDALINAKLQRLQEQGLLSILCIGETIAEREAGMTEQIVLGQLTACLQGISLKMAAELIIAYEPVWAIGTGKTATAADAQEVCGAIRATLLKLYPTLAEGIRILYGGSMKPENAAELLSQSDINGGLVGGASLEVASYLGIAEGS
ncbi:MAG: triose-phosphate isomerase [Truepera sp.]|nr:triose-phosphate isomerase [Truepera sp.]